MKTNPSLVLAGAGLALAAPSQFSSRHNNPIFKRTGYEACDNDCTLRGSAFPNKHTLQLALENNYSEQCPPIYIGDPNSPTASSRVCLDFVGSDVHFNFEPFPGYTYGNAAVTWKLKGNVLTPSSWSTPPPTNRLDCGPNPAGGSGLLCKLPFSAITGASSASPIKDLLSGMCPNGDREGLNLYLEFSGEISSPDATPRSAIFHNQPPCAVRDASTNQCTSRTTTSYIEMVYRCSTCEVAACPPEPEPEPQPPVVCDFGTAFGYQSAQKSITLDTQSGSGCKKWGWYSTPTLAELQSGISGPLYAGAGGNDISKATNVGTWVAVANSSGRVTVTYTMKAPYALSEAHVDLECLPIDKCAPGTFTFGASNLNDVPLYQTTGNIKYPTCSGGSKAALIVHAAVHEFQQGPGCQK